MKVILVGNVGIGKSSFFVRFKENRFVEQLHSTIGLDQATKDIQSGDGKTVKVNLWDTGGLEVQGSMTSSYYRMSKGIVLMYDVKDRDTLSSLRMWLNDINPYINEHTTFFLLGNKIDSFSTEIDVNRNDAVNFAKNNNIPTDNVFQISVKTGNGFENFITSMATILSCGRGPFVPDINNVNLGDNQRHPNNCC
ncbi:ras-related protein Rab-1B-like [Hydra vulgaris]|uniref:Ras-related protein Rab-1B-like n=1 Tax=Hydra vulgaris TaxID=6087 RepID=A0ABM4DK38_HYDVU